MTLNHIEHLQTSPGGIGPDSELSPSSTDALKSAFAGFPSGVAAICATVNGKPVGFVSSSFAVGVSFDPPLVLFSVQNSSRTWPVLRTARSVGISVLGSGQASICSQLASRSRERFAGLETYSAATDALFIHGSPVWLDCRIMSETPAGDHHIVVLRVDSLRVESHREPLVYHRKQFRRLLVQR